MRAYLLEVTGFNPVTQAEETLYFSSHGIPPFPSNDVDRPDVFYDPRITDFVGFTKRMFSQGRITGKSSWGGGTIEIDANDNYLYNLRYWGFGGREINIYVGDTSAVNFSEYSLLISGYMDSPTFTVDGKSGSSIQFKLRDKYKLLDKPLQSVLFRGDNQGANGNEGNESLKDKPKPLCFGTVFNIQPVLVNESAQRYQIHNGAITDVIAVYDGGDELTESFANPPPEGHYYADLSKGIITLGVRPAKVLTCDVIGSTSSSLPSDMLYDILTTRAGFVDADLNLASFADLNADAPHHIGFYASENYTIIEVCDTIIGSVGGYFVFDRLGILHVGVIDSPNYDLHNGITDGNDVLVDEAGNVVVDFGSIGGGDTSQITITDNEIIEFMLIEPKDTPDGIPASEVVVKYGKLHTVQTESDLTQSVVESLSDTQSVTTSTSTFTRSISRLKEEYLSRTISHDYIKTHYLLSQPFEIKTQLCYKDDADVVANRLSRLLKIKRSIFRVVVPSIYTDNLDLNDVITIDMNKFNLDGGVRFKVITIAYEVPSNGLTTLEVWG